MQVGITGKSAMRLFAGGFAAMIGVAMIVGFSSKELNLSVSQRGSRKILRKIFLKQYVKVFWRILLFYILAILIISLIIPYTDPNLLRNDVGDISVSPFTLVFKNAGVTFQLPLS